MVVSLSRAAAQVPRASRRAGSRWQAPRSRARGIHHVQRLQRDHGRGTRHPCTPHGPLLTYAGLQRGLWTAISCGRVGMPTLRPEDVARLARAYYHADLLVIDETSVRGEDGRWHYRDLRMRAEWPMRSRGLSSRESSHRNRPLRYDGRVVVTLCAEEILSPAGDNRGHQPATAHTGGAPTGARATGGRGDADGQSRGRPGGTRRSGDCPSTRCSRTHLAEHRLHLASPAPNGRSGDGTGVISFAL